MGQAVERLAGERGHEIVAIATSRNPFGSLPDGTDVIIDFSHAASIGNLVDFAMANRLNLVTGTTGWDRERGAIEKRCCESGIGVVHAANFSPGANVLFALAREAAHLFSCFPGYESGIEERHHSKKRDAPSGTAIGLADAVAGEAERSRPAIASSRVGSEYGLHTLFFDSPDDLVEISHRARSRDGFARGALLAAEMVKGRKGFFSFEELIALQSTAGDKND